MHCCEGFFFFFAMHLRNGKVVRAPSTPSRTVSDLKRPSDSKFVDVNEKRNPPNPAIHLTAVGQHEKLPAPKFEDLRGENVKLKKEVEFLRGQLLMSSLNN